MQFEMFLFCKHLSKVRITHTRDSSKVRGEVNSGIFMKQEILSGPEDALICLLFVISVKLKWIFFK